MIRNHVVHCLNALGIVAKKQRFNEFVMKKQKMLSSQVIYLNFEPLFFRYEPFCMSLYGVVADYSWSG